MEHETPRPTKSAARLNIAVLLDYANFVGGGCETHLREALDARCRRNGHTLLLLYGAALDSPHPSGRADNAIFNVLRSGGFDGFIVASAPLAAFSGPERVVNLMEKLRPASLCSMGLALPGIPSLVIDNRAGFEAVVDHMIREHGCRRPAFIGGPPGNPDSEERLQALRTSLQRNGLSFDPGLVARGSFRTDHARAAMEELLARGVSFDCVVAGNDHMAVGVIETLRKWGRRVPRDVPVTGFDDLPIARLGTPPLTTVSQSFEQLANLAVETIEAQCEGRAVPDCVVLPTQFVCRQSCGCKDDRLPPSAPILLSTGSEARVDYLARIEALRPRLRNTLRVRPDVCTLLSNRLLDALVDVVSGHSGALRRAIGDLLEDLDSKNDSQQLLQDAITLLRDELAVLGDLGLERAFYEGLSLIANANTSTQLQQRLTVDDSYYRLLTVGGHASLALDLSSLKAALTRSLPAAGIRTIFLSCAPTATATDLVPLVCLVDGATVEPSESSFPASRLLPSQALGLEQRRTFLVFPMAIGTQLLGVAAVDNLDGISAFEGFRSEITLVLRSIHLHQDLIQETMLRERSVQERLATTKRMEALSVLAGGVAHDLNNALGPLVALPDVILDELDDLPVPVDAVADLRVDVESIRSASLRAAQTIKDLLTLGRQGRTVRKSLDMNRVVESCVADASTRFTSEDAARVKLVLGLHPEPLRVRASESQLARAVGNLLRNAVEASGRDGQVEVRTSRADVRAPVGKYESIPAGRYAVLSVSDHGGGISERDLGRLFEPFFTTKPPGESSGSGLGLAIVHGVVKEHEGFIDVRSAPDAGTTFELYLPLVRVSQSSSEMLREPPRGHAKILIVDDEPSQLRTCQRVLERLGYAVEVTRSGTAAYELFRLAPPTGRSPFDLVITDMVLNEKLDGLQLIERIKRLFPEQKTLLVSGHALDERAEQARERGLPWLHKPYAVDTLACAVEQVLADQGRSSRHGR